MRVSIAFSVKHLRNAILIIAWLVCAAPMPQASGWLSRPWLSYFGLTSSLVGPMQHGAALDDGQMQIVQQLAYQEAASLRQLEKESQSAIAGDTPRWWKRLRIFAMGYNRRVDAILLASNRALQAELGAAAFQRLRSWAEARWRVEQLLHGQPAPVAQGNGPRSFQVYATRYDAKGRYTAALPDKCVKFTNGGLSTCEQYGYIVGGAYEIFIGYQKAVGVRVAESGPWNIDDTYWATAGDPTPRRMFADLGLGMPEAQAAFYNGYNGGVDQFGRKVTAPFGIDLAFEVASDIGLQAGKNDWVTVTFQWTANWGQGGEAGVPGVVSGGITPVETAAPNPDGSVVHVVQYGQSMWAIAVAYETTIQSLYDLNQLDDQTVIWPGDELVVHPPDPATPTVEPSSTPRATVTRLGALVGTQSDSPQPATVQAMGTQAVQTAAAEIYTAQTQTASNGLVGEIARPVNGAQVWLWGSLALLVVGIGLLVIARLVR